MPYLSDPRIDLVPRQLPALARLGALRHLDLQFPGVDQIQAGDAEAAAGDLFDGAVLRVAVGFEDVACRVFAALAGVAFAADAIHGDRERLVRFLADRAVGHRARLEALHDDFDRLDFLNRDRLAARLEVHES